MSEYLPTPIGEQGKYAAQTFELFQASTDALDDLAGHAKSERTQQGYRSDWRRFSTWAGTKGINVPAVTDDHVDLEGEAIPPALVMLYLADVQDELKPATVTHHLAAIRHFHHQAELTSPTDHPRVRETLAGYVRKHAAEPRQAAPISGPDLIAMVEGLGDGLRDKRDRAILTLGLAGAFRRSELVGLDVQDLVDNDDGLDVILRRSKTDQEGKGRAAAINYWPEPVCPVRSTRGWLKAAGIESGPVFRMARGSTVGTRRLNSAAVGRIVKAGVTRIGKDPDKFSAHSLRAGHVSYASSKAVGAPKVAIRAITGHKSAASPKRPGGPLHPGFPCGT